MKTMKCSQLGGACDLEFKANTFDEMASLSQAHGMEMYQQQDAAHLEAMGKIQEMMKTPGEMEKWQEEKRKEFEALPES
jgi:predicted small metal-binding protein